MCSSCSTRTPKLRLAAEQASTGKCWIPSERDTPLPRTKKNPQQYGRSREIVFRIKPHNCQKCSEGSNKTLCIPGDPQRLSQICLLVFECLLQHYGSAAACCRGRGFGCSRPGCGIRLLGDGHRNPTIEPQELTQDWGNRL